MSKGQSAAQWPLLAQQSFQHTLETAKRSIKTQALELDRPGFSFSSLLAQ